MRKIILLILLVANIIIWMSSCEEVIEWKVKDGQVRVVVEGSITNEYKKHSLILSRTLDYFSESTSGIINDAEIRVSEGENIYLYEQLENGLYQSIEEFAGEVGKTYHLRIILNEEIGGFTTYEASTTMTRLMPLDSISVTLEKEFGETELIYTVNIFGQEPAETEDYYKANIYCNGVLLSEEELYYDDMLLQGMTFDKFAIFSHEDIKEGDEVLLELISIEKEYFRFLTELTRAIDGGDPFGLSGPPANAFGNISNKALGYFYAGEKVEYTAIAGE